MAKRKDKEAVTEVEQLAEEVGCEVMRTDKGRLNVMSDSRLHQAPPPRTRGGDGSSGDPHSPDAVAPHPALAVQGCTAEN